MCGHISEIHQFTCKGRRKLHDINSSEQRPKLLHIGAKKKIIINFILKTELRPCEVFCCFFPKSNKKIKNKKLSGYRVSPVWLHIIKVRLNLMGRILSQYLGLSNHNVVHFKLSILFVNYTSIKLGRNV